MKKMVVMILVLVTLASMVGTAMAETHAYMITTDSGARYQYKIIVHWYLTDKVEVIISKLGEYDSCHPIELMWQFRGNGIEDLVKLTYEIAELGNVTELY